MGTPISTGAKGYFAARAAEPGYRADYDKARRAIDQIDGLIRGMDERREELGLSKSELAEQAGLRPEVARRLFTVDEPNPTLKTLVALSGPLGLSVSLTS